MNSNRDARTRRMADMEKSGLRPRVSASSRAPDNMDDSPPLRAWLLTWLARFFFGAGVAAIFVGLVWTVLALARPPAPAVAVAPGASTARPTLARRPSAPTSTPNLALPLAALLAGHSGSTDTGAICADGLREVDVTTDVAGRAANILQARGYRVDILAEFDARLSSGARDYAPKAFLAIHADSCVYTASGYKVARAGNSAIPAEDDRLVRCVTAEYGAATQLPFNADTITSDMTQYHAFHQIASQSPGAIIELGFLGSQHDLLKDHRDLLGEAVANGVDDFLQGNQCRPPAAH